MKYVVIPEGVRPKALADAEKWKREQGYTDGHAKGRVRFPDDPVYMAAYRRGSEAAEAEGEG